MSREDDTGASFWICRGHQETRRRQELERVEEGYPTVVNAHLLCEREVANLKKQRRERRE
jgi:hypothetical protein